MEEKIKKELEELEKLNQQLNGELQAINRRAGFLQQEILKNAGSIITLKKLLGTDKPKKTAPGHNTK